MGVTYLDEEPVALLPDISDALGQKHDLVAALIAQYHSVLEQAIKQALQLVWYAKESIPQDP